MLSTFLCMPREGHLLIEHLIILLDEEVCGSWKFHGCMGSQIHNQMLVILVILDHHIVCVISLRGLKKGECSHACARMSARGSLEYI
jgi:uncharacterized membrane protein